MGEGQVCLGVLNDEEVGTEKSFRAEAKRGHDCLVGDIDSVAIPNKKQVKEASNDDVSSEVFNPTASPRGNASSYQTTGFPSAELASASQAGSPEITSTCSENSTTDSLGVVEGSPDDLPGAVSTSRVVLEVPKHASSSGIRKITFKFSKRVGNDLPSPPAQPATSGVNSSLFARGVDENPSSSNSGSCPSRLEFETSNKVTPESFPTSVKKLLMTGVLEGAKVKYISVSQENKLCGVVRGCGYLCGCSECNFSSVLTAYEFEVHAGGRTRHPNNHIYLENGKSIYSIVHELRTTPLGELDDIIRDVVGSIFNEAEFNAWRASFQQISVMNSPRRYRVEPTGLPYSHASHPSPVVEDLLSLSSGCIVDNFPLKHQIHMKNAGWKQTAKMPSCYVPKSITQRKRTVCGGTRKRDNDLHKLLFLPTGLPDGAELAYCIKGQRVLGGYKQGNGIFCSHCNCEISPSQFEAHAGWAVKRQPYRHIYTSNGLTLHDIALSLASGQSLTSGDSDDMCTVCGDGGDLICCHGCPRAFHSGCLGLDSVPESSWSCTYCRDKLGPATSVESSRLFMIRLTHVMKAQEYERGGCFVCGSNDFTPVIFDERTVIICDQCEREYHVACLRETGRCDLKELPKGEWFCTHGCSSVHLTLQNIVSSGTEIIPASILNKISTKKFHKGVTLTENEVQWRILRGKNRLPEHSPYLSKATEIFRERFDPINVAAGRDLIPVMVYGRNISGQEFGGMHCVVLIVKSVVVSACLLRVLGQEAAELPLVATSRKHQGKGYFQVLFSCIERLLSSLNVRSLVIPAADQAESIWTKKFGFKKMTNEKFTKFVKHFSPTVFGGTSMLEKDVQWRE